MVNSIKRVEGMGNVVIVVGKAHGSPLNTLDVGMGLTHVSERVGLLV